MQLKTSVYIQDISLPDFIGWYFFHFFRHGNNFLGLGI